MKKTKILAVLPYEGLKEQILKIAAEHEHLDTEPVVVHLDEAVATTKEILAEKQFDAIISRGGTAERLRGEIDDVEIVEIPVGSVDIFHTIIMAKNYTEKFAIQSFPTITRNAERLCNMLQYDIDIFTIHSPEESLEQLKKLREDGYSMIVGDVTTAAMARQVGMNAMLILSGDASIRMALDQVIELEKVKDRVRKEWKYLDAIQRNMAFYIVAYSPSGKRVFSNDPSRERFPEMAAYIEKNKQGFMGENLSEEYRPGTYHFVLQSETIDLEDGNPITVIYGRRAREIEDMSSGGDSHEETGTQYMFKSAFGVANSVGEAKEAIERYCNIKDPVLILGEAGCGKDQAAAALHRTGDHRNRPYTVIDFARLSSKEWNRYFRQSSSPLMDVNSTIYFKNLQEMSPTFEKMLIDLIETTNLCGRNQVILSAVIKAGEEACSMARYMLERSSCVLLQATPLRKRKEDIMNICTMYLSEINAQSGTQILGLDEEAREIVENYSWPGNINQLRRVLKEAARMTEEDYITEDTISRCIYNEAFEQQTIQSDRINLNQSLDDIIYDLVRVVLKEENMNRQRTADRLKISRTTLWRILRSR